MIRRAKILLLLPLLFVFAIMSFVTSPDDLEESVKRGEQIYTDFCVTCHLADGKGVEGLYPPLAGSDFLLTDTKRSIYGLKFGLFEDIVVNGVTYNTAMPAPGLTDEEVADVMNYILNSWGNKGNYVSVEKVKSVEQ